MGTVSLALDQCLRLVRNGAALHNTQARGHRADCAQRHYFRGRYWYYRAFPPSHSRLWSMGFEVVVGPVQYLPDTIKVGFAVGNARWLILTASESGAGTDQCQQKDQRLNHAMRIFI